MGSPFHGIAVLLVWVQMHISRFAVNDFWFLDGGTDSPNPSPNKNQPKTINEKRIYYRSDIWHKTQTGKWRKVLYAQGRGRGNLSELLPGSSWPTPQGCGEAQKTSEPGAKRGVGVQFHTWNSGVPRLLLHSHTSTPLLQPQGTRGEAPSKPPEMYHTCTQRTQRKT